MCFEQSRAKLATVDASSYHRAHLPLLVYDTYPMEASLCPDVRVKFPMIFLPSGSLHPALRLCPFRQPTGGR